MPSIAYVRHPAFLAACGCGALLGSAGPAAALNLFGNEPGAAPFGALSMAVLVGTLGIGAGLGAAATAVFGRGAAAARASSSVSSTRMSPAGRDAASGSITRDPPAFDATPASPPAVRQASSRGGASSDHVGSDDSAIEDIWTDVPLLASFDDDLSVEDWIETIAEGPRFGPRIVGVMTTADCDQAATLAEMADAARAADRDVVLVDAAGDTDALARALDGRLPQGARRPDYFGAGARVEIVPMGAAVFGKRAMSASHWRDELEDIAARTDVLLVSLPDPDGWDRLSPLLSVLDETVLVHARNTAVEHIDLAREAADDCGVTIAGRIIGPQDAAPARARG